MDRSGVLHGTRVLIVFPGHFDEGVRKQVADGELPQQDYLVLRDALGADVLDYADLEASHHPLVRLARLIGMDAQLAALAFLRRRRYDVMFSLTDSISLPLAALFAFRRRRPRHIVTAHSIGCGRRGQLLRFVHRWIDRIIVYSPHMRDRCVAVRGVPASKVVLVPFNTDEEFYRPIPDGVRRRQICCVGRERRDFRTLIAAAGELDVDVRLTAFSPFSKDVDETRELSLPQNFRAERCSYRELRRLYAESQVLVLPLHENEYAAGVTALYEAMAMECPAIVSGTTGLQGLVEDGVDGIVVPPGDPAALRDAIQTLLTDPDRARQLGQTGRRLIENRININAWVNRMLTLVGELADRRR